MLTFDGIWHNMRCSLHGWIPVLTVQGRRHVWRRVGERFADVKVVDRVAHGGGELWYWQEYVIDNEHRGILLMAFWMHRDTVTRSWGPLLCHSSKTITLCCSMIMHGPMLQGFVHNSWKLKTSQFLHGQHTHQTCHHWACLGCSGSAYRTVCSSSCQTSHSHWRGVDQHSTDPNQQPDQLYAKEMCCTAWGKWWLHQILTGFRTPSDSNTVKLQILEWPFIVASLMHTCEVDGLSRQRRSAH